MPVVAGCSTYASCAACKAPLGKSAAAPTRIAIQNSSRGVSTLPIRLTSFPGDSASQQLSAKKNSEKSASGNVCEAPGAMNGTTPISNDTVAVRGMAKSGPMVK